MVLAIFVDGGNLCSVLIVSSISQLNVVFYVGRFWVTWELMSSKSNRQEVPLRGGLVRFTRMFQMRIARFIGGRTIGTSAASHSTSIPVRARRFSVVLLLEPIFSLSLTTLGQWQRRD